MTPKDPQKKILIVDDDPFILEMYMLKFREQNFTVETATNAKEALTKIKTYEPSLVLLDIVMPGMDGFQILRELKKSSYFPTTIILSNLGQQEDIDRGIKLGAKDYIVKAHLTPSEVVERAKQIINPVRGAKRKDFGGI